MQRDADILILGGGVMGLSIAYYAAKAGLGKITIVERRVVGRGASSRNSGAIREQYGNEPMIRLTKMSIDMWQKLPSELEWNLLFDQKGYLILARTEPDLASLNANVALQNRLGVGSKIIGPGEISSMVPALRASDIVGASFNARDGAIHHDAVIWAYERAVRKMGVRILEGIECESIMVRGGKTRGAVTSAGAIHAKFVVNATGVSSLSLCAPLGIALPVRRLKREVLVTESYKHCIGPVIVDRATGLLVNQLLRGEIVCDSDQSGWEGWVELDASLAFAKKVASQVCRFFPSLSRVRVLRQWAGEYDLTPDRNPILGETSIVEGLYLAVGFSGHGFMVAPGIGALFAAMMSSGRAPSLVESFNLSRFNNSAQ